MSSPKEGALGIQPVRAVMKSQRWQVKPLAEEIGVSYMHLYNVVRGVTAPSPQVREALPRILDLPLEELFTGAALATRYNRQYTNRGSWARES